MGKGKQAVIAVDGLVGQNPIAQLQVKYKELEAGFQQWLAIAKHSLPVEVAIATITSSVKGAAVGGLIMGLLDLTNDFSASLPPPLPGAAGLNSLQLAQALARGPLIQARNFAAMTGVNAGITCVMKRLRGKEDIQTSMVAAFASGAMFSLVSGKGGPNLATNAVASGLFFALAQGGLFKIGEKFSRPLVDDVYYSKTRNLLTSLGLQQYEENFKKGLLNDDTLPLLTDIALQDVRIPPGPRLIILDRVKRDLDPKGRKH